MGEPTISIAAGGRVDPLEERAVVEAVSRILTARDARRSAPEPAWSRAGRSEAAGGPVVRSRANLPGA